MTNDAHHLADAYDRAIPDRLMAKTSFVSLEISHEGKVWHTAGALREPASATPRAAVVIVHGSGGVDSRGQCYANALNEAGFVTFEIDLWAARGVLSPQERPKSVTETLPDAFTALDFLSHRRDVDSSRIGIMGTSWGGIVSMLSATEMARGKFAKGAQQFAAHAPLYPACWVYNHLPGFDFHTLSGAPVFIQTGADDLYDDPDSCERLVDSLTPGDKATVSFATYAGATHAWDRREPDIIATDPFAHKGAGGEVPFRYNLDVTRRSTEAIVEFFARTLARKD